MSGGMKGWKRKKRTFEEWLQFNSVEKYERYREKNVETKRKVEEVKRMSNFIWGLDFNRSYEENKKKFVPSTTYLRIIVAYILLLAGGSGCFKARTNSSVGWVVHRSGPPE